MPNYFLWNKGLTKYPATYAVESAFRDTIYSLNTEVLIQNSQNLHPRVTVKPLCTVLVYIDVHQPYWLQVDCDDKSVTHYWICQTLITMQQEADFNISFGTRSCEEGFIFYNSTCYKFIVKKKELTSRVECASQGMVLSKIFSHQRQSDVFALLNILANYDVHNVEVDFNNETMCLKMKPELNVCHPHAWSVEVDVNCTNSEQIYVLCEKQPLEHYGCSRGKFECIDGSCILQTYLCDGKEHCLKGEDEANCWCVQRNKIMNNTEFCLHSCKWPQCKCAPMYFQCREGGCIHYALVCDGVQHCLDGSDEWCTDTDVSGETPVVSGTNISCSSSNLLAEF